MPTLCARDGCIRSRRDGADYCSADCEEREQCATPWEDCLPIPASRPERPARRPGPVQRPVQQATPRPRSKPKAKPKPKRYERECVVCQESFVAKSAKAKCCSDQCRKALYEMRHAPASQPLPDLPTIDSGAGRRCAYCGGPATDDEHVTPRSYIGTMQAEGRIVSTEIVPSCRECNSVAGAKVFASRQEKGRYIGERMAERYAKLLATPNWTDDELADVSYGLRAFITGALAKRDTVWARLAWNRARYSRGRVPAGNAGERAGTVLTASPGRGWAPTIRDRRAPK